VKPLFTIHAGEFLVGSHIERGFPRLRLWLPSRDTGVDLLVTDSERTGSVALQVKFSRDFLVTHMQAAFQAHFRACGWWKFDRRGIERSEAQFWVLVLVGFQQNSVNYVVLPPDVLLRHLTAIHGTKASYQSYLWVTRSDKCWEARGLRKTDHLAIANDSFSGEERDFSKYLNDWSCLERLGTRRR
jgi:hypothetical protein